MINKKFVAERITDKKVITREQPNQTAKDTIDTMLCVRVKINLGEFLFIQGGTNSHELFLYFSSAEKEILFFFFSLKFPFLLLNMKSS